MRYQSLKGRETVATVHNVNWYCISFFLIHRSTIWKLSNSFLKANWVVGEKKKLQYVCMNSNPYPPPPPTHTHTLISTYITYKNRTGKCFQFHCPWTTMLLFRYKFNLLNNIQHIEDTYIYLLNNIHQHIYSIFV